MRGARLERVLAGTALALVLSLGAASADWDETPANSIEAFVPMPEPAGLPPPTIANIGSPQFETKSAPPAIAATSTNAAISAGVTGTIPQPAANAVPSATTNVAQPAATSVNVEEAIPLPDAAGLPPPSIADVGKTQFPGVAAVDIPTAEKLSELITGRQLDRLISRKADKTAIQAFYSGRSFNPLWTESRAATDRTIAVIARLKAADKDGLDPDDYSTPDFRNDSPQALAEAEIKMTSAILTYARHAQSGRVHPGRISSNIEYSLPIPEPTDILSKVAASKDLAQTLDDFNPPHPGFRALRAKLAEARGRHGEPQAIRIPSGAAVKPGKHDSRVPLLRERFDLKGDAGDMLYDARLADAVKDFQREKGIKPTGTLTTATIEAMNGRHRDNDADTIVSNMERWRWLPRDIGKAYAMVNIPDFSLKVVRNSATIFHTRIVVGKPVTPTPIFSAMLENILVNPTWHVPESIIYGEYLPALQQDPEVLRRMGLILDYNRDGTVSIRQPPGERNALGRIKFNFPNRFQVYLHDTPDKNLFAHDKRAYSHGCMRVQNPTQFGEVLASLALPGQGITASRLESLFGTGEHWLRFTNKIPVHLTYMNAYVDDAGKLVVRDDLYGIDSRVQSAIKGDYRVSEIAPPPEPKRESAQVRRYKEQYRDSRGYGRREAYQSFPFFGLFFQ